MNLTQVNPKQGLAIAWRGILCDFSTRPFLRMLIPCDACLFDNVELMQSNRRHNQNLAEV